MWKSTQSFQQTKRRSWAAKKTHKIDLFSCHLLQEGVCVKHALDNGDANTMIVQQLLNKAAKKECSCSLYWYWLIFALLQHFDISGNSRVITTKQGLSFIEKVVSALDDDLRQCLLISHAISGCDTVNFDMGNLKAFNRFKESSYCRSAIKTLCDDDIEIDRMVELGEKF